MRLLIFAILIYILYRVVKNVLGPKKEIYRGEETGVIDEMVQDPSCKTYIPRRDAIRKVIGGQDYFFCSDKCVSKFEDDFRNNPATKTRRHNKGI